MIEWIGSDESTKNIRNPAERSDMPLKNDSLGFLEECNLNALSQNWNELSFDESDWESPMILDYPIKTLLLDENAPLYETLVYPEKILHVGQTYDVINDFEEDEDDSEMDFVSQCILEGQPELNQEFLIDNLESILGKGGYCTITPKNPAHDQAFSLFLQFPRE